MRSVTALVLFCVLLFASGCVREVIEPEHNPRVTTSQNSDGVVSLSWKTESGYVYRLYTMNPDTREWSPMKGGKSFRGTGETITVHDKRNPRKPLPWYSVRAEPQQ